MASSGPDAGRIGADFGARLASRLGVPDWLVYHAFDADIGVRQPYLRIAAGLIDLRPKLARAKRRLERGLKGGELPPIGHLHIPKTAGTYTQSLQDVLPHINFSHVVSRTDRSDRMTPVGLTPIRPEKLARYFLFTNVRNPFTYLVSYYHHTKGYPDFINPKHYDFAVAQTGFEALVRAVIGREDGWPSRRFLFPQLFDQSGRCIVTWINRADRLDADIGKFASYFGLTFDPQERRRVSPKSQAYSDYYSADLLAEVADVYAREMKLFGFRDFDLSAPMVELQPLEADRLRYEYRSDALTVDGAPLRR